jgi:predicted dehydrogenase
LEAAEKKIQEYSLNAKAGTNLSAILLETKPDFVVDLTVPEAHCAVTCTALAAGCHVIGEKPMANSMDEARKMVAASKAAGKLYMVSQSRRWDVKHVQYQQALASGEIGPLTTVNCDFYLGAHFGGFRDEMPSPLILDMAIHHFDMCRLFTQARPLWVYAHEFNPRGSWYKGDVAATCIFQMSDGIVFTYRGSWCAEGCHTSWNGNWRVVGEKGTILYEQDCAPRGEVVVGTTGFFREKREAVIPAPSLEHLGQRGALREFLEYLRTGKTPQCECQDNIQSLAMVFAAMESSRCGRRVDIAI